MDRLANPESVPLRHYVTKAFFAACLSDQTNDKMPAALGSPYFYFHHVIFPSFRRIKRFLNSVAKAGGPEGQAAGERLLFLTKISVNGWRLQ